MNAIVLSLPLLLSALITVLSLFGGIELPPLLLALGVGLRVVSFVIGFGILAVGPPQSTAVQFFWLLAGTGALSGDLYLMSFFLPIHAIYWCMGIYLHVAWWKAEHHKQANLELLDDYLDGEEPVRQQEVFERWLHHAQEMGLSYLDVQTVQDLVRTERWEQAWVQVITTLVAEQQAIDASFYQHSEQVRAHFEWPMERLAQLEPLIV